LIKPVSGKAPFAEKVLVDVGYGRRIRVDAGVAGVGPREERAGGARRRPADARLQDAVAFRHTPGDSVEARLVERMRDDADETPGRVARQSRVRVERDAVADRGEHADITDLDREAGVGGAAQQPIEFFDLAALAFPAHPRVLAFVPLARAMEQEEAAL